MVAMAIIMGINAGGLQGSRFFFGFGLLLSAPFIFVAMVIAAVFYEEVQRHMILYCFVGSGILLTFAGAISSSLAGPVAIVALTGSVVFFAIVKRQHWFGDES